MKRYVGIDPGISVVGLLSMTDDGAVEAYTAIKDDAKVKAGRLDPKRLASIVRRTHHWLNEYTFFFCPTVFCIEEPIGRGNSHNLKGYGVFAALSYAIRIRIEHYKDHELRVVHPMTLKKFVGASGFTARDKPAMRRAVKKRWGFENKSHDIVDAYALARFAMEA